MKLLDVIDRIASKIAPGPPLSFTIANIIKTILIIGENESIGRVKLSKKLELGEGSTRTLLKHLRIEKVINITESGASFTKPGKKIYQDLKVKIPKKIEILENVFSLGRFNFAILVKNASSAIGSGVEQRDAAIKAGAKGAITLVYHDKKLIMPKTIEEKQGNNSKIYNKLLKDLKPLTNDAIIIGCAESRIKAEYGAIAAVYETLKKMEWRTK